jgi:hypothetical protein
MAMSHWQQRQTSWWETNVVNCSLCGQMIPRDIWVSDDGLEFCSVDCEKLYRDYWIPTYGERRRSRAHTTTSMNRPS